jgi:acetolactate synthase I/III small subunit
MFSPEPTPLPPTAVPADHCPVLSDKLTAAAAHRHSPRDNLSAPATGVIELRVRNHPGVMSHITGLFARRTFNLEAIVCAPSRDDSGATSRVLLLVEADARLEQVERQLRRLHDVLDVRHRADLDREFFARAAHLPS